MGNASVSLARAYKSEQDVCPADTLRYALLALQLFALYLPQKLIHLLVKFQAVNNRIS
jgi:hypothetical protein